MFLSSRRVVYFRRILHGHQGIILIPLNLLYLLGFSRYCQTELLFWKYTMFFHCQNCLDRKEIRVHHHHGKHKDVRIHCCSMCPARRMGLAAHSIRGGRRCHPRILHSRFAVACNYRSRRRTGIFSRPLRPLRVLRRNASSGISRLCSASGCHAFRPKSESIFAHAPPIFWMRIAWSRVAKYRCIFPPNTHTSASIARPQHQVAAG